MCHLFNKLLPVLVIGMRLVKQILAPGYLVTNKRLSIWRAVI